MGEFVDPDAIGRYNNTKKETSEGSVKESKELGVEERDDKSSDEGSNESKEESSNDDDNPSIKWAHEDNQPNSNVESGLSDNADDSYLSGSDSSSSSESESIDDLGEVDKKIKVEQSEKFSEEEDKKASPKRTNGNK